MSCDFSRNLALSPWEGLSQHAYTPHYSRLAAIPEGLAEHIPNTVASTHSLKSCPTSDNQVVSVATGTCVITLCVTPPQGSVLQLPMSSGDFLVLGLCSLWLVSGRQVRRGQ